MVLSSDTPLEATRVFKMSVGKWLFVMAVSMVLSGLSWGEGKLVEVGKVNGLSVSVAFPEEPTFARGSRIHYQVVVKNKANASYANIQVQSSLHSDGSSCDGKILSPGAVLKGASVSSPHKFDLAPGSNYDFDVSYEIPADQCPTSGHMKVRLQYFYKDKTQVETMTAPVYFQID